MPEKVTVRVFVIDGPLKDRIIDVDENLMIVNVEDVEYRISRISLFGRRILIGHTCDLETLNDVGFAYFTREELKRTIERESWNGTESQTSEIWDPERTSEGNLP